MKTGIELIREERKRQIEIEGWTSENDDQYDNGALAYAAAAYALAEAYRSKSLKEYDDVPPIWPFEKKWWKPTPNNRIRELQKAGALIAAEIDRLQRPKGMQIFLRLTRSNNKWYTIAKIGCYVFGEKELDRYEARRILTYFNVEEPEGDAHWEHTFVDTEVEKIINS